MGESLVPLRDRQLLATALPELTERFPTHAAYADAGVAGILRALGPVAAKSRTLQAHTLASHVLIQRNHQFIPQRLPAAAQWSPAHGLAVADFDGDGHQDIVVAQNQFTVRPEDSRAQSGRGLWLRGDGQGGFTAESSGTSGLAIDGDQRGAATADFDEDGRPDLVITQNAGPTRLFHNSRGKPGIRVQLQGVAGNSDAIGAVLRPVHAGKPGPACPVTAGGGYGSQASPIVIIPADADAVEVRWSGGKVTRTEIKPGTVQLRIPQ